MGTPTPPWGSPLRLRARRLRARRRTSLLRDPEEPRDEHYYTAFEPPSERDRTFHGPVEGATTKEVFETYVEHFLAPALKPGQVVVMDNLGAHRPKKVRELIEGEGCELLYLPPYYSPDLNPIEEAFSKVKHTSSGRSALAPKKLLWKRWAELSEP